ncbi:N-6 DNA methylase [Acinetobacter baumannii]|uniref:N-6 DNA methylase n=1 Tax=Acinetobacter calcoaceticus/baumannii complex TaxID=909768 RepID=UPI0004450B92|nr:MULTISPECIES: N-6 DNA methylase [Acinetobacter calcoaceticus/baumannii complex]EXC27090.1 N-6 DNA Methylase family protein [Acinetobacter sp. 809848]MDH2509755.1 N-6 DNA methylase [Acinetobacter baumannii]
MNQLSSHNQALRILIENTNSSSVKELIDLDSIDIVLRECLSIDEMREAGSFFTGQNLATTVIKRFQRAITFDSVVLDPTCGAGNLLIECSRFLGVEKTLTKTLEKWGVVLWGFDIHESFIDASKLRLVIEALSRGVINDCSVEQAMSYFENIKVVNALNIKKNDLINVTHVVMNPPFTLWDSPNKYYWKKGKINAAGIVFDHYLRILPESCLITAILPDVLRSGSRYELFREFCSLSLDAECEVWGRFNAKTDVDVFNLHGLVNRKEEVKEIQWQEKLDEYTKISEIFDVCVGPLVAYRDLESGPEYPYFHSKNTPKWEVITQAGEKRKFKGKVISPPFVLIKRTSSPGDKNRATATLINLKSMVAVENHLIVIKPKNNSLNDCKRLMKVLSSEHTNEFLNKRIRLRHLTVQVVKEIPFN